MNTELLPAFALFFLSPLLPAQEEAVLKWNPIDNGDFSAPKIEGRIPWWIERGGVLEQPIAAYRPLFGTTRVTAEKGPQPGRLSLSDDQRGQQMEGEGDLLIIENPHGVWAEGGSLAGFSPRFLVSLESSDPSRPVEWKQVVAEVDLP
ncbi:MAG: hypothetical protein AAF368_03355, partial [Planctomycetota bacterium]